MNTAIDPTLQRRLDEMVEQLNNRYGDRFGRDHIQEVFDDSVARLATTAKVTEYLPAIAYKFASERLGSMSRTQAPRPGRECDVVFVSLSGGGRGQIAAALTTLLSDGQVTVHSAGTAVEGTIDPAVRTVLSERGIDASEAFARPVTDEVLEGADVIVTMGHSVGVIEIPTGVRHEDWRVGDPIGASVDEARRVRDDIERRVRTLLQHLDSPSPDDGPDVSS